MATSNRDKGANAEREFAALVSTHLGVTARRNLEQVRSGGHDLDGVPGWAIEVKTRANWPAPGELVQMWAQTLAQAERARSRPLLALKVTRRGWACFLDAADLCPQVWAPCRAWVRLEPEDALAFVRERLGGEQ